MVTAFGEAIDGADMVWDVTDLSRPQRLSQFEGGQPLALSPDGRTVATIAYSGQAALWNVTDPRHPVKMTTLSDGDGSKLEELAFSPDGQILATARYDKIFLWDMASPARPRLLRTLDAPVTSPAATADTVQPARPGVLPRRDHPGQRHRHRSGHLVERDRPGPRLPPGHPRRASDFVQAFTFSPRGNLLAAVTHHGTVLVYSLADPARPARTATIRGLLTRAVFPSGSPQPRRRRSAPPATDWATTR